MIPDNPRVPSVGVQIFGILQVLLGILGIFSLLGIKERDLFDLFIMGTLAFNIFLGFKMLQLKPYARIATLRLVYFLLTIYLLAVWGLGYSLTNHDGFICLLFTAIGVVIASPVIFFLRHPKVREQFTVPIDTQRM